MGRWSEQAISARGEKLKPLIADGQTKESADLAVIYDNLESVKENFEEQVKSINLHLEALRCIFTDRFAEEDTTEAVYEKDGKKIKIKATVETGLKVTQPLDFINWLKETGQEGELRVPANSVGRIVREARDAELIAEQLPPGVTESEPFIKFTCKST